MTGLRLHALEHTPALRARQPRRDVASRPHELAFPVSDQPVKIFALKPSAAASSLEGVTAQTGIELDYLIGLDVLRRRRIVVDLPGGRLTIDGRERSGPQVPVRRGLGGLPFISLTLAERTVPVLLDTGALLSYLPVTGGSNVLGREQDFLPGFGRFSTPVHEVPGRIGIVPFRLRSGVFPPHIAQALSLVAVKWVVGTEVFLSRPVELDLPASRLRFA